jgi:hypothetical protein
MRTQTMRSRAAAAAAIVAIACAGCGSLTITKAASGALDAGAKGTALAVQASRELTHALCPSANLNDPHLSTAKDEACAQHAERGLNGQLKAQGVNPTKIAAGGN